MLRLNVGVEGSTLLKWREKRANKALYELQIEVCEEALKTLRDLPRVEEFSKRQRQVTRTKIQAEIQELKWTKKPFIHQFLGFFMMYCEIAYTAEIAARVRRAVETGSKEDIDIP
jgi:hypothetical protein